MFDVFVSMSLADKLYVIFSLLALSLPFWLIPLCNLMDRGKGDFE